MEITVPENPNYICRFCALTYEEELHHNVVEIGDLLTKLNFDVSQSEILPCKICWNCFQEVNKAVDLKTRIQESEELLLSVYTQLALEQEKAYTECAEFSCLDCQVNFLNYYQLSAHKMSCNRKSLFEEIDDSNKTSTVPGNSIIKPCDKIFSHRINTRGSNINNKCESYKDGDIDIQSLINHKKTFDESNKFPCTKDAIFTSQVNFIGELYMIRCPPMTARRKNRYNCELCCYKPNTELDNNLHFLKHVIINSSGEIVHRSFCEICGKIFLSSDERKTHIADAHKNSTLALTCVRNNITFDSESSYFLHQHPDEGSQTTFSCKICIKSNLFESKEALFVHALEHLAKRYSCLKCKDLYISEITRNQHLKKHAGYRYSCTKCSRVFANKGSLNYHLLHHDQHQNYICEKCGKTLKSFRSLQLHHQKHYSTKQVCNMCNYSTVSYGDLQVHKRVHTNERPYKCTYENCGKSYKTCSQLSDHTKGHLKLRNHICSTCNASFTRKSGLKYHEMTHTSERPFVCDVCFARFTKKYNLKIHVRSQHPFSIS